MTSPETSSVLNGSVSSSPRTVRAPSDHSPVRRRSSTVSEVGEHTTRPRLSPTLIRTYNPLDPDVRERQRTMDADMAIQLSRARSSIPSPTAIHPAQTSPVISPARHIPAEDHPQYPNLSAQEEHDVHAIRSSEPRGGGSPDIDSTGVPPPQFHAGPTSDHDPHFNHLSAAHDPGLLVALDSAPAEDSGLGGLPMYQPAVDRQAAPQFDFTHMEEFAREEKVRLGLLTPVTDRPGGAGGGFDFRVRSAPAARNAASSSPPPPDTQSTSPDASAFPSTSSSPAPSEIPFALPLPRTRHRKLSHSNPHPRRGKLALFEQPSAPPPALAARVPHLGGTALSAVPSYDNLVDSTSGGVGGNGPIGGGNAGLARAMNLAIGTGIGNGHDRPYRFSFYSNALSATIHARSLSELPAEGQSFEDLFFGRNASSTDGSKVRNGGGAGGVNGPGPMSPPKTPAFNAVDRRDIGLHGAHSGLANEGASELCTWWLDVLSPTDEEMKLLSKVFNIHPLTTEDIQMEETREKIELFRNYYFVCFRGFDQDPYSPTHLEPLNMYIIVFREGILSFHYRPTPHPQNVRRRIKQLKDYISVTSDWISYALIDDITDAFGPLIQGIEYEVDSIDELVLILKEAEQSDMLRRIGTCRKKVMGLLRLMGNKADVVKGLAKRCNENWRVAPTSDIGLYLSDIQDHLITMTQNLNHYEKILSRSHSNYLAQISIEMTDANNQINDVLSKLTALGTVLIPMNLITGLWGMNVHVPGQDVQNLHWFGSIIAVLAAFAVVAGWSTYRLMVRR